VNRVPSRFLIIGAQGFIGAHLARVAADRFEVFSGDLSTPSSDRELRVDITDPASVRHAFDRVRPDLVALAAAVSDIDLCEREKERAAAVNVTGAGHVVGECARIGARLVFTSSAAVFAGTRHGYREEDPPNPVSFYGQSKARAEAAITATLPGAVIVRMALVLGFGAGRSTNALLNRLADSFRAGRPVTVPDYEYRNPIDAGTLSRFIVELAASPDAAGIFHIGSSDSLSRFELVSRLAGKMGYSRDLVVPQRAPVPGRAPRGLDHFLLTGRVRAFCRTPIPSCDQVIERCFDATS